MARSKKWIKAPPRKRGVLGAGMCAPIGCPDATPTEYLSAIAVLCYKQGFEVGQGGEYDQLRDVYRCIGKSRATGKAQDINIEGAVVAELIGVARQLNGGPYRPIDPEKVHGLPL